MRSTEMLLKFLSCFLVVAFAAGCAPQPPLQASQLQTPRSFEDLLLNMKRVTQSGLILQTDFYAEDNLKRVFGGSKLSYADPIPYAKERISFRMKDFPDWLPRQRIGDDTYGALDLWMIRALQTDDMMGSPLRLTLEASISLSVSCGSAKMDFESVERLFGTDWAQVPRRFWLPPHGAVMKEKPPTRPHGNVQIAYVHSTKAAYSVIAFEFGPDATVIGVFGEFALAGLKHELSTVGQYRC